MLPRLIYGEHLIRDLVRPALEPVVVNDSIRKQHDVGSHSVLMGKVDDRGRVCFRKPLEQADFKAVRAGRSVPDLGSTGY
jgi:hypothetical protein